MAVRYQIYKTQGILIKLTGLNVTLNVTDTQTNDTFTQELSATVQKQQSSSGSSGGSLTGLLGLLLLSLFRFNTNLHKYTRLVNAVSKHKKAR